MRIQYLQIDFTAFNGILFVCLIVLMIFGFMCMLFQNQVKSINITTTYSLLILVSPRT